jgi:hypothetical protein
MIMATALSAALGVVAGASAWLVARRSATARGGLPNIS